MQEKGAGAAISVLIVAAGVAAALVGSWLGVEPAVAPPEEAALAPPAGAPAPGADVPEPAALVLPPADEPDPPESTEPPLPLPAGVLPKPRATLQPSQRQDYASPSTDDPSALPGPAAPGPNPPLTVDIACGRPTDGRLLSNHGQGDPVMTDLTWAATKTGFRFVTTWNAPVASQARINYELWRDDVRYAGGLSQDDATIARAHYFILDGMPTGDWMRFNVQELDALGNVLRTSETHDVVLCNAFNAWSEVHDQYIINLLMLGFDDAYQATGGVTTVPAEGEGNSLDHVSVELGATVFAKKLHDGTDGGVTLGAVQVIYNEFALVQGGHYPVPTCSQCFPDVVFTYAENPQAAGSAALMGIASPTGQIVMNQKSEAFSTPEATGDFPGATKYEVGSVLTHEFGHYGFGMMDQYESLPGNPAVLLSDCTNGDDGISIMGASRMATEFDDAHLNRCPNELGASGTGRVTGPYIPSWDSLIAAYPRIPDRIDAYAVGPVSEGATYSLGTVDRNTSLQ